MNIQYIRTLPGNHSSQKLRGDLSELAQTRTERVSRYALLFYTKEEVEQAATNRRSSSTDEAVIADFMTFEFPKHEIPKDMHYIRALETTRKFFDPGHKLHPIAYPDLRYYPWNLRPSAEAPWSTVDFKFTPTFRNLDDESESPKLKEHIEKLSPWISERRISISVYLRNKHVAGIINDPYHSFHNLYNEIFQYNRLLIHQIKDGLTPFWKDDKPVPYYYETLHARSHVVKKDEKDKIRAVFGATKLLLMAENMFIWPLQATYLNNDSKGKLLWGRETIKGGWKKLFSEVHQTGTPNTCLSLDWSQFDKRLLFELITAVHKIWRSYFDFSRYTPTSFYPNAKANPIRIERLWKWICHSILHTPILLPNGELYKWTHNGFGSGFQQTQLMDSFANMIMILTCLSALGIDVNHETFWIRVQGDDSIIAFYEYYYVLYGPSFLLSLADAAMHYFNAKLSTKKSLISDRLSHMSVLGYFNSYGIPYRLDEDLLSHLMFPERPGPQSQLLAAAIGLAYSACGCSQSFHDLCQYIIDKLTIKGFEPDIRSLRWMTRANILEFQEIEAMVTHPLPARIEMLANIRSHTPRSKVQKERLWPTEPGPRNRFYFLSTV